MEFDPVRLGDELIQRLRTAEHITVLSGAGISAESGVPTFRDAQTGLWAQYDPQELATPKAFERNPRLVWEWYAWRRKLVAETTPNQGHLALAMMEKWVPNVTVITQNIDSLHQRAGSAIVIELHGNLARVKCLEEGRIVEKWDESEDLPPRCPFCGAYLRPDVVWFGEMLPPHALNQAMEAARGADVFLTIGTSGIVQPAASLPLLAIDAGALAVEINPSETPLTQWMNYSIQGNAGKVLPALISAAWPQSDSTV